MSVSSRGGGLRDVSGQVVATVIGGLVVAFLTFYLFGRGTPAAQSQTPTERPAAESSRTGIPEAVRTQPVLAGDTKKAVSSVLVTDLTPVESSFDLDTGQAEIGGNTYPNSLIFSCDLFCNGDGTGSYVINLGRDYSRFTATIGVLDTGANLNPAAFEVSRIAG